MLISNIKRMYERNFLSDAMDEHGPVMCEKMIPGFWDIIAEYFTHK